MELLGHNEIFDWVDSVAKCSEEFTIVSPFFSVDPDIKNLLMSIPSLKVFVGDEFASNNPRPLEELSKKSSVDVRCLYKKHLKKRLHAKVFYAVKRSGRCQALVGSANFTVSGLTKNEEQAVSFDSSIDTDCPIIDQIGHWVDQLERTATEIDWKDAKRQFRASQHPRIPNFDFDSYRKDEAQNYWVLKTTEGKTGASHWIDFVRENVVSIGWNDLVGILQDEFAVHPNEYTYDSLDAATEQWDRGKVSRVRQRHAAKSLYWFCREFSIGDRLIVCRGYAANQTSAVDLYGLAIVDGDVYADSASNWWLIKRPAVLLTTEANVSKSVFTDTLQKNSLLQTIHRITKDEYDAFRRKIQEL